MVVESESELVVSGAEYAAGKCRMIPLWHAKCSGRMIQPGLDVDGAGRWNVLQSFHVRTASGIPRSSFHPCLLLVSRE